MRAVVMSMIRWTVRCGGEPPIAGLLAARPDPPSGSGALPNVDCWRRPLANVERSHNQRWIRRCHAMPVVLPCLLVPTLAFAYHGPASTKTPVLELTLFSALVLSPIWLPVAVVVILLLMHMMHNKNVELEDENIEYYDDVEP